MNWTPELREAFLARLLDAIVHLPLLKRLPSELREAFLTRLLDPEKAIAIPNQSMTQKTFLFARRKSSCCDALQLLVRSREGGYVTCGCLTCDRPGYVLRKDLPSLLCEVCGAPMDSSVRFRSGNYGYRCTLCGRAFELFTRLPWWHEHFPPHGIATPSEYEYAANSLT